MHRADTNECLRQLLILHHRSLPMYLGFATPWFDAGEEAAREALQRIIADQQRAVERLGDLILDSGEAIDFGNFPLRYSAYHDLSFRFLLPRMIEHQQQMVEEIVRIVEALQLAPVAQAVAQEALGEAKGHLEILQELAASNAAEPS